MCLSVAKIRGLIDRKVLLNADVLSIGQVTYDFFCRDFHIVPQRP